MKNNKIEVRYKHLLSGEGVRVKLGDGKSVTFTQSFEIKKVDEKYRDVFIKSPNFEIVNVKTTIGGKKK